MLLSMNSPHPSVNNEVQCTTHSSSAPPTFPSSSGGSGSLVTSPCSEQQQQQQQHWTSATTSTIVSSPSPLPPFVSPEASTIESHTIFMPSLNFNSARGPSSSLSSMISEHSSSTVTTSNKRGRDDDISSLETMTAATTATASLDNTTTSSIHKRTRENAYIAPRRIPPSFTSVVGTLAANVNTSTFAFGAATNSSSSNNNNDTLRVVPHRRQLSGSRLEAFLSAETNHDDMEIDTEATRPRSMSF